MKILLSFFFFCLFPLFTNAQNTEIDPDNPRIVKTKYGYVKGKKDKNNTLVWKGIPYAKPPVGNLRWKAPQEPNPWTGILKTGKFSNHALQYNPLFKNKLSGNEDCLYLNIWKPASGKTKLPVYVWIHGGGNTIGYANQITEYYGNVIAEKSQVIFVSINYRLGPFGWLTHPALRDSQNPADNSGNYGTLDIIQSLKWIKENIVAFGGDPDKILISGESAGGINVLSLLISPRAEGLFSAALCQSGIPMVGKLSDSELLTEKIILKLLVQKKIVENEEDAKLKIIGMTPKNIKDFLYEQKGKTILKTLSPHILGMIDMPMILCDGYVIPKNGYNVLDSNIVLNKVPLMIGSNTDEMKTFLFFSKEPRFKDSLYQTIAKYGSDLWKAHGVDEVARKLSSAPEQPPVYVYLFNWGKPEIAGKSPLIGNMGEKLGAHHMAEIKFFLGTDKRKLSLLSVLNKKKYSKGRNELSDRMMSYAANLLYYGNPNDQSGRLPYWTPWDNNSITKGIILDADKNKAIISNLNFELYSDSIVKNLNTNLNKNQLNELHKFMFILK
jgi:para-nitrobenzyl esterase